MLAELGLETVGRIAALRSQGVLTGRWTVARAQPLLYAEIPLQKTASVPASMPQTRLPLRLLAEILGVVVLVELAVMLVLPQLAGDLSPPSRILDIDVAGAAGGASNVLALHARLPVISNEA